VPSNDVLYLGKKPLWQNPLVDWNQYTTPQAGLNGESVLFSQGHTLGGGSARNFMWYQRGCEAVYDQWAKLTGDASWSWKNFDPFMKKAAQFTPTTAVVDVPAIGGAKSEKTPMWDLNDWNPQGGPLQVAHPNFLQPSGRYIVAGLSELGFEQKPGMVNGDILGWTNAVTTIDPKTRTRSTSSTSYLRDSIRKSFNLHVFTHTLGKKILFDINKKAYGVELETFGTGSGSRIFTLNATNEVVVSAGVFRSPQLLMVSGIGPKETLAANGIEVLSDLPGVGQNLMDHIWTGITHEVNVPTIAYLGDPAYAAAQTAEYNAHRTGMHTNPGGTIISFEKLPNGTISDSTRQDLDEAFGGDWPDVEYFAIGAYTSTNDDYLLSAPDVRNYTAMAASVTAPFSRGNVTINSTNTNDHPIVNPAWITDPRDMEVFIAAFKRVRQLFKTKSLKQILIGDEMYPGANVTTDAQIEANIRKSVSTVYHPACTCKMGGDSDPMAVLDGKARVRGVQGLRVVDASSFPVQIPGHPQGTVYGLAEKIADDILQGR
jgi:choline dehydrogenase